MSDEHDNHEPPYSIEDWTGTTVDDELDTRPAALTQEEVDRLISWVCDRPVDELAVIDAVLALPGGEHGVGSWPDALEFACADCGEEIERGAQIINAVGYIYHSECADAS